MTEDDIIGCLESNELERYLYRQSLFSENGVELEEEVAPW